MLRITLLCLILCSLSACGGGGGGGGVASGVGNITTNISGIGATGAAIANGTVNAQCVAGTITPTITDSNGNYSLTLTNATLPCIVQITVPGTAQNYYSIVENGSTTANVTPLTNLISDALFGANSSTVWANFTTTYAQMITVANIAAAQTKIQTALTAMGIDITQFDALKSSFTPATSSSSGSAQDQKLDQLSATLTAANTSLSTLSTAITSANTATVAAATASTLGPAATQLGSCPYVRGGNYWTFLYNGSAQSEWTINLSAMTANVYGSGTNYTVSQITSGGTAVPCAFTITIPASGGNLASVITAYFSKSSIFAWKQVFSNNTSLFGLGVPVQSTESLKSSQYAGTYPMLGYVAFGNAPNYYQATLPMQLAIDSSGNITTASCALSNGTPSCGSLTSGSPSNLTCGSPSQGMVTCTDGTTTVKAFAITTQQQPTIFMLMNGTTSSLPFTAFVVGTKSRTVTLPAVGDTQNSSTAWYLARVAQANPNSSWNFVTGDTNTGAGTTVASVNTANSSYTTADGLTFYGNTPATGFYWVPSITNSTFPTGSPKMLGMISNSGWSMRAYGLSTATTFDNFNGIEFFIKKPM